MRGFSAIVGLTLRNALRSHVFQLLAFLLIFLVCVIPLSIGGGTAQDFIRVSLFYSIWAVGIVLVISSLYLGCYVMTQDVDSYQLHMVVAKPVSRVTVWLGKWCGVNLIHLVLLFLSMAAIYGIIFYRYRYDDRFTEEERKKIADEVLVGRRVFRPELPDFQKIAREELQAKLKASGEKVSMEKEAELLQQFTEKALMKDSEVPPEASEREMAHPKVWVFKNLPDSGDYSLCLRFRPYLGKISSSDQRNTRIVLAVLTEDNIPFPLTNGPEQFFSGLFYEKRIPAQLPLMYEDGTRLRTVGKDGTIRILAANYDPLKEKQYYQPADGPKLLIRICGFEGNYLRAVLMQALMLMLISALSCSLGGFLSLSTSLFLSGSYLLLGALSPLLTNPEFIVMDFWDQMGRSLASLVLCVVTPLQVFDVTDFLAGGELIEYSHLWTILWKYLLLKGLPVVLLGIWLYRRRELGLTVRK